MGTGIWRDGHWVCVNYEDREAVTISKNLYELRGYQPPYEQLPTKDRFKLSALRAEIDGGDG